MTTTRRGRKPGTPKTGGRQRGTRNRATTAREQEIKASGVVPLEYMLAVMREENEPPGRRDEMAKAAAPYVHPKLASTTIDGELTVKHEDALAQLE